MKRCWIVLMAVGLAFSAAAVAVPSGQSLLSLQTSFQGLGGAVGAEMFQNGAWGISADGTTIVGSGSGDHAFVWKEETGMVLLPEVQLQMTGSTAFAVNQDGTIAAGCVESSAGRPACRWIQDQYSKAWNLEVLGDLAGGTYGSNCYAMSADGKVLAGFVNFASAYYTKAARWTLTEQGWGIEYLGDLPGGTSNNEAWGCSVGGAVVVGRSEVGSKKTGYGFRAFRWTSATGMVDLGVIGTRKWSEAKGCSDDGSVVVGHTNGDYGRNQVAFRWSASTGMVSLGLLSDATASEARAVSPDGSIVVGRCTTRKTTKAFIWDATNGMRAVVDVLAARGVYPPRGWSLLDAYGVATPVPGFVIVVGKGRNPQGYIEAWRAVIEQ